VLTEQTFYTPKNISSYVSIHNICGFLVKSTYGYILIVGKRTGGHIFIFKNTTYGYILIVGKRTGGHIFIFKNTMILLFTLNTFFSGRAIIPIKISY